MNKDLARYTALEVLLDVNERGSYSNLSMKERLRETRLSDQDKKFITELVYGTLENQIHIDWIINQFAKVKKMHPVIQNILRLGLFQLLYLSKVPSSAAVNESVTLAKIKGLHKLSGFVNGVLRNIERNRSNILYPDRIKEPARFLSVLYSYPLWLIEEWIRFYGMEFTEKMIAFREEKPSIVLRPNLIKTTIQKWEEYLEEHKIRYQKGDWVKYAYYVESTGDISRNEWYRKGLCSIQSESSMLVCLAVNPEPGQIILDACSAPGGKAAFMAELMGNTGNILAWDMHAHRVELILQNIKRLGIGCITAQVQEADNAREEMFGKMDAVLVDAPCSGLGVIGKKPEIKYRKTLEEIKELAGIQLKILRTCCKYVKPGGTLVYSTCTINPIENEQVVRAFLLNEEEFELCQLDLPFPPYVNQSRIKDGYIQLFPHLDQIDGFFICKLKRKVRN